MRKVSRPVRGAWIEIAPTAAAAAAAASRPVRGAWIEMYWSHLRLRFVMSRPVRGAWIEMQIRALYSPFDEGRAP